MSQEQQQGKDPQVKPLPVNAQTMQKIIQVLTSQQREIEALKSRMEEIETRFEVWLDSYKNALRTLEVYISQQAAKEAAAEQPS